MLVAGTFITTVRLKPALIRHSLLKERVSPQYHTH